MLRTKISRGLAAFALAAVATSGVAGIASATTPATKKATTLSIKAASATVTSKTKDKVVLTATLKSGKTALAHRSVKLSERTFGTTTWKSVGTTHLTSKSGHPVFSVTQKNAKEQYRLTFAGTTTYAKSTSKVVTITRK